MARVVNKNFTDTPPTITELSLDIDLMNFGADYAVKSDGPDKAVITNLTSPRECPEQMIFAVSNVTDIYKGRNVDPAYKAASKAGYKLLSQVNSIYSVTDSVDDTYRVDLPLSAHLVLDMPADSLITSAMVMETVGRAVHGLYETEGSLRVDKMARGALIPSDL